MGIKIIWSAILTLLFFCTADLRASEIREKTYIEDQAFKSLEREIQGAAHLAGGIVGVYALHLETGRKISFHAQERFPMASVYKIPIAVQLLHRLDQGELSLDKMITIQAQDLRPGSSLISSYLFSPGVMLSVRNLLELMLVVSDNTATDILLRLAGGPKAVTARLRDMGIWDIDVSRPTINLIADATGFILPPEKEWNLDLFKKLHDQVPSENQKAAAARFVNDLRDTSTPEAMVKLLKCIYQGEFLKEETKNLLLDIMARCQTGRSRIKGFLLPETVVAHKTGTIAGITNDAGYIKLPNNDGTIALAIFIKLSDKDISDRERAIAHMSRTIYDYFLFHRYRPANFEK
ncbi:MAG: class A beta-lactamase [Thermodesulfobacteriota bacterium]